MRFEMHADELLIARVDAARGKESRAAWFRRVAEERLERPDPATLGQFREAADEAQALGAARCESLLRSAIARLQS